MRRSALAMALSLGFGLAVTGCGPTTEEPAPKPAQKVAEETPKTPADAEAAPKGGPGMGAMSGGGAGGDGMGIMKGGGGAGGQGGPPGEVMKSMQSDEYRKMAGAQGPAPAPKAKDEAKPAEEPKKPAEETKKEPVALSDDEIANVKKLSPQDQKLAMAQLVCLVGEDEGKANHLGSMGMPIKETVKGKTVFLCCKGCVEDLMKDPDKFLAKLPK